MVCESDTYCSRSPLNWKLGSMGWMTKTLNLQFLPSAFVDRLGSSKKNRKCEKGYFGSLPLDCICTNTYERLTRGSKKMLLKGLAWHGLDLSPQPPTEVHTVTLLLSPASLRRRIHNDNHNKSYWLKCVESTDDYAVVRWSKNNESYARWNRLMERVIYKLQHLKTVKFVQNPWNIFWMPLRPCRGSSLRNRAQHPEDSFEKARRHWQGNRMLLDPAFYKLIEVNHQFRDKAG